MKVKHRCTHVYNMNMSWFEIYALMKNLTGVVPGALQMVFEAVLVKTADE